MEALKASDRLLVLGVGVCSTLGTGGGGGLDKSMGVLQDEFGVTPVQLSQRVGWKGTKAAFCGPVVLAVTDRVD